MGMFSPPYTYYNNPSSQYQLIGGAYYLPGTAAAKKASQLAATTPQLPSPTSTAASIIAPYARKAIAPTSFPSYPGGSIGGGSVMPGAPGMTGQGAFGLVPQKTNPLWAASQAIGGNTANLAELSQLGTGTTKLAGNLAVMPFQQNLPGYEGMIEQSSQNILSNLQGIIDPSTWEELQQKMAERGTSVGITPASPNFDTALMRALGENITSTEALGQQQLNAAIGRTPTGQPFNIAGQQVVPGTVEEAGDIASKLRSAPDPTMAAQANLDMLLRAIEAGRAGGIGGMGGYGGGGGMPRLSQPVLSPVSAGYPGFSMPNYPTGGGGWSGITDQPFYRTSQPTAPGYSGAAESNIPQYWPEGMPGEQVGEIPQYWPEPGIPAGVSPDVYQLAQPLMDYSGFGVYNPMEEDFG